MLGPSIQQGTNVEVKCAACGRASFINKSPVQGSLRAALIQGQKCPSCGAEFLDESAAEEAAKASHVQEVKPAEVVKSTKPQVVR
jgi:uncharacterized OB-fold protein